VCSREKEATQAKIVLKENHEIKKKKFLSTVSTINIPQLLLYVIYRDVWEATFERVIKSVLVNEL